MTLQTAFKAQHACQLGQQVAAPDGGMGRAYNGGYAEYTVVPRSQVIPFRSTLPCEVLGPGRQE